jgi:pimeloyl-ACP methyl ester carboxylesterase
MPVVSGLSFQLYDSQVLAVAPAVVLIHGAGGNHLYWPFNLRRLPGYRVYAPDLPGHGKSGGVGERTIGAYAGALVDWLQAVGLERVVLVGHSMGSAIALWLAVEKPELVAGLGLLGSSARLNVNPALMAGASQADTFMQTVETVIHWSFSPDAPADLTRLAARRMAEVSPGVLYDDFLACNAFDLTARLAEIRCPTLVVCGAQDKMTPLDQAQHLAGHIPASRLEVVPNAGHMVMLEQPFVAAEILARFLSEMC